MWAHFARKICSVLFSSSIPAEALLPLLSFVLIQARLAALGVQKHAEILKSCFSASMKAGKRPWKKSPIPPIELRRRSERLKNNPPSSGILHALLVESFSF
jgi:hypothetical protein